MQTGQLVGYVDDNGSARFEVSNGAAEALRRLVAFGCTQNGVPWAVYVGILGVSTCGPVPKNALDYYADAVR